MMIRNIYFMFFICMFMLAMAACTSKPKEKFKNIDSDRFEQMIGNENIQCVDVRKASEFNDGHIKGALNINVLDDNFALMAESLLTPDFPVAVYCRSGKRSRKAAKILTQKGFRVYNLDKGIENWKELGKEIEK